MVVWTQVASSKRIHLRNNKERNVLNSKYFYKVQNTNKILSSSISANRPLTIEELRDYISSELEGNPPLWITRAPGKYGNTDVYINNAMILLEQSNFQAKLKVNEDTMTQVNISVLSRGYILCTCKVILKHSFISFYDPERILCTSIGKNKNK